MKILHCIFIFTIITWCNADTIYFKSGSSRTEVSIISEDHNTVAYRTKNGKASAKTDTVEWVEYSDCPPDLIAGRASIRKGDYKEAIDYIQSAIEEAKLPPVAGPWFEIYSNYYLAKANQRWADSDPEKSGRYQGAIQLYEDTLKLKNNRYLYECYAGLAKCYISLEKYDDAGKYLTQLELQSRQSHYWQIQTMFLQGLNLRAQKNYTSAINRYERAKKIARDKDFKDLQLEASIQVGNCHIENKNFSLAKTYFEKIKDRADKNDHEQIAAAENGLAACLLAQGKIGSARRKVIQVILKYYEAEKERPRALYISGQCYEKAKETGNIKRAKTCYQFLVDGYPGNPWTVKALRKLQQLNQK